eukprot:TRINITY_DN92123_c0_g1_i1.p1 TRINITY_DN92123_c0_g1~~TRINITY_DN92123_c0_g1_i1.p1  ORF type:complete len:102 (+),score=3.44 TRINITY_DN92123_c0_g1_i1:2-307(+)
MKLCALSWTFALNNHANKKTPGEKRSEASCFAMQNEADMEGGPVESAAKGDHTLKRQSLLDSRNSSPSQATLPIPALACQTPVHSSVAPLRGALYFVSVST